MGIEKADAYVLITGVTSDFGTALAGRFADEGWSLILSDAEEVGLEPLASYLRETHGARVLTIPTDISERNQAEQIAKYLKSLDLHADILVNIPSPAAKFEDVLWRNVISLTSLARLVLPGMVARRKGRILNAAVLPPDMFPNGGHMDFAVKNYMMALSRALETEFGPRGIKTTLVSDRPDSFLRPAGPSDFVPETAAREAFEALMKGEQLVVPGESAASPSKTGKGTPAAPSARRLVVPQEPSRRTAFKDVARENGKKKDAAPSARRVSVRARK